MGEPDYLYRLYLSSLHGESFYNQSDPVESQPEFRIRVDYSLPESDPDVVGRWELRISGDNINPNPESILRQLVSSLQETNVPFCVWNDIVLATTDVVQRSPPSLTRVSIGLRIVIDRYLNIEEAHEEEEEEYEDVIFVWEMLRTIGLMLMSLCRRRRDRCRVGYTGKLETVRVEGGEKNKECTVCLEEFVVGLEAVKLPCEHVFHGDCVRRWFKKRDTCPLCRNRMSSTKKTLMCDENAMDGEFLL